MPRQERAERSRAEILDAAAVEFDAHGYAGARLDRIIERTRLTKGAVYFHFRSKLDLAEELVAEKYGNWPELIAAVDASGATGVAAARDLTARVAAVFATDVRVRAAMKLSRTVLPPGPENDPYARWTAVVAAHLARAVEAEELPAGTDPVTLATVAVQAFFGAYLIADERGSLDELVGDAERIWDVIAPGSRR